MALTKKILVELGLDDKQAEAVLKKFREEAEKPVNAKINLDDINQAMGVLRNFFKELKQGLGGNANFSKLSSSIIEVEKSLKSVINTTSKISAIKVEPVGLDSTKEKINEISEGINKLNKEKPDTRFFANIESHLKEIYTLVNSIVAGMQFDKIRPSQIVEKELAATEKALKTFNDPGLTKESIEQRFAIASGENPKDKIQKLASDLGKGNKGVDTISNKTQISNFKTLISYMKDYIRLEGDLNNVKAGSMKTSLGDVYNNIVKDMNLADNPEIKQQIQELKQLVEMRKNLPKLQEELQLAQSRENRSVKATFDPGDMEQFAAAMTRASAAAAEFNKNNTEKNILGSFSEEQFTGMLNALQAINGEIKQINESLKFLDTSKLQAEINEGINKTPIKINVKPELSDPAGFVGEVEKQLAGHKVKLGIDLTNVQKESSEATEKVSLSDLSGIIDEIQRNASAAADAVERITKKTSNGRDASYDDFKKLSEVLDHLKTSLDNIKVEKLNSLSDIFTKLSGKNKLDERIESICNSIVILKETLDKPSGASGFIQELNTLASQGESLKDLAAVLKASKKQIEKAKDATTKKPVKKKEEKSIDVSQARKRLESTLDGKSIDGLGKFSQSDIKKNGSAILTFVDELEGKVVTTKVKVLDLNDALDKVASNKLSTKDYEILNQKSRDKKQQQTPVEEVATIKDDEMEKINNGFSSIRNGANTSSEAVKALNDYLTQQSAILAKVSSAANETAQSEKKYAEAVKEVTTASAKGLVSDFNKDYTKLENKSAGKIPEYSTQLEGMKSLINQLDAITSKEDFDIFAPGTLEQITGITSQIKTLNDELKQTKKYTSVSDSKITGLQKQMATWELKNGKALSDANVRKQFDDLYKGLKNGIPESEFDRIQAGFNKIVSSASKAGKTGKTFFEGWKSRMTSLAQYLTTFASFYDVINVLRQAFDAVVQLDSAITELEKVSEASGSRLNQSFENAKKTAQDLGATVTDTINATADWSRIGYSIDQSEQLAEASIIYKNVGDGIDIDTANESLISTLQGFELEASQAMEIVDSFNEVNACLPA